jgi:hypothetical protein
LPAAFRTGTAANPTNNAGSEHYVQFYSSGGTSGRWNDLPASSVLACVVEYGGMAGDPTLGLPATA